MNNARRKIIAKIIGVLEEAIAELEPARDDEQEAYDNMPASLQDSERGGQAAEAANALDSACSDLQSALDSLSGIE